MVKTVFALMFVFSDGYLGGHTTAGYYKDKAACDNKGSQVAAQYAAWGHPASFVCTETAPPQRPKQAERTVIHHNLPTLVAPEATSTKP